MPRMSTRHLLLQLSDLHLVADGELPGSGADPLANLEAAVEQIGGSGARPEAIVLTGDLADRGEPAAYVMLRRRIEALCDTVGAEAVYLPGNHDDRAEFRRHLLDEEGSDDPIHQVRWFGDLRLLTLDSVVPGDDAGRLEPSELEWVERELASATAPDGTILALHHPPVRSPIVSMADIGLAEPEALERLIEGTDVCLVICGHNHHASAGAVGSVPVFVAPALAYLSDPMVEGTFVRHAGSAFGRIDLINRKPLISVVQVVQLDS